MAVWPARVSTRLSVTTGLGGVDATVTRAARRSTLPLMATQVALGFVLLTAGGLTITSLATAWRNDAGFERDQMVLVEVFVSTSSSRLETFEKLEAIPAVLGRIPGVERVAVSTIHPFFVESANRWTSVVPQGWTGPIEGVVSRQVSPEFFDVMGLRLVDGRWPGPGERKNSRMAIVSETAARMLWTDRPAVGRGLVARSQPDAAPIAVIGVVADARYVALDQDPVGDIYLPDPVESGRYGVFVHVRTTGSADAALPAILSALPQREFRITQASTHQDALFASVKHRALPAWLFGSLGLAALLLLGVGLLGLLAMSAAQRTREIGIRIALGATAARVVGMLVAEQFSAIALGLATGAVTSAWAARLLESQLYAVRPYDPGVWTAVVLVLILVTTVGTLVPALRAARLDPVRALRSE